MKYNTKNTENIRAGLENPIPPYVNWEVTNRCNMGCPYCFLGENPEGSLPDLPTGQAKSIIKKLADGGARMLNYAGGEPLVRDDILELMDYGKGLGLKNVLSTNGILLSEDMIKELGRYLDWISLPVDGYDPETHDSIRGRKGHFNEIMERMEWFGDSGISLKINTMLCRKNAGYAERIAKILDDFDVKKWKLFQFSARGKAKKIREEYEIADEDFLSSRKTLGKHSFDIIYSSNELRDNAYFLIGADGKVHAPAGDEYFYLADMLSDDLAQFRNPELLKIGKNLRNAEMSYDLR